MKGYYNQEDSGTGLEVPTGRLSIEVKNLSEFRDLIKACDVLKLATALEVEAGDIYVKGMKGE